MDLPGNDLIGRSLLLGRVKASISDSDSVNSEISEPESGEFFHISCQIYEYGTWKIDGHILAFKYSDSSASAINSTVINDCSLLITRTYR